MGASKCEICGSREGLIVHHRSYEPEVTELLCRSCHSAVHNYTKVPKNPNFQGTKLVRVNPKVLDVFVEKHPELKILNSKRKRQYLVGIMLRKALEAENESV